MATLSGNLKAFLSGRRNSGATPKQASYSSNQTPAQQTPQQPSKPPLQRQGSIGGIK